MIGELVMKKRISLLLVLLFVVVLFSGCVRSKMTMKVKWNGLVDVTLDYGMDSTLGNDGLISEEQKEKYKEKGFSCEDYSKDGYDGSILTKNNMTASEVSDIYILDKWSLTKFGNSYVFNMPWSSEEDSNASNLTSYASMIRAGDGYVEFIITLPVKPTSHNATSVSNDGKTLTWDLLNMGDRDSIHLEYTILPVWIPIAIACAIVAIIISGIIVLVLILKKKKEKTIQNTPEDILENIQEMTKEQSFEEEMKAFLKEE